MHATRTHTPSGKLPLVIKSHGHVVALDGLRGVAIAAVVAFHYLTYTHHNPVVAEIVGISRAGWLGVDLFFVLSGFLITGILLRSRSSPTYYRDFYIRRTLRIFPLYYAVLAIAFLLLPWVPGIASDSFAQLQSRQWGLWLYATNIVNAAENDLVFVSDVFEANHFWSLAAEEQFYLLWPALVRILGAQRVFWVGTAIVTASFAFKAAIPVSHSTMMLLRSDGLVLGGIVAAALANPTWAPMVVTAARRATPILTLAIVGLYVARGGLAHDDAWANQAGISFVALASAALLVTVLHTRPGDCLDRVLSLRPLVCLGRYSYGIYVIHWAFDPLFDRTIGAWMTTLSCGVRFIDSMTVVAVETALAVGLAALSFHFFEMRFLVLKDRFAPVRN